ncbi:MULTISPECIES: hypothetical protein [unclassified Streptomyces]|uniref:hypothetical protein n=1 Tax=unclassified Streptomyces TaxID=2593676 RepID=UPI001BE76757|nr:MULTISPECIES: hypothetical protein [unclassified Streptomyces]MBT2406243.1 hypothetical protein [Streptomyces sp. ISL-21]MBT2607440.1 hypothetical protein [Streptomyces sp. ISL-87]
MSRAAPGTHPHLLTPVELSAGDEWVHGCDECCLPIQGGAAGLAAHRRTVHDARRDYGDRRTRITIQLEF